MDPKIEAVLIRARYVLGTLIDADEGQGDPPADAAMIEDLHEQICDLVPMQTDDDDS